MKRKINLLVIFTFLVVSTLIFTQGCSSKQTLLFLNWGEYINDDLVTKFEEQYNCNVVVDIADSNELFYAKLKSGTTAYDLCCPADYMVEKMYIAGLIQRIDDKKMKNFDRSKFMSGVLEIQRQMNETMLELSKTQGFEYHDDDINYYHIPYFWGSFGLLYNRRNAAFDDVATYVDKNLVSNTPNGIPDIFEINNPWQVYYEADKLPSDAKVGMYSAGRFAYAAAMFYNKLSPNVSPKQYGDTFKNTLMQRKYVEWSSDHLKHSIESGNIDLAFAYTGDCLDMAYLHFKDGTSFEELPFYVYVPENTILHSDTLVIPSNARHVDLAHKFLDFMLEPENAYENTSVVGYCPPLQEVYNMIVNKVGIKEGMSAEELNWLNSWGDALKATFPMADDGVTCLVHGVPLSFFDKEELTIIDNIMNTVKTL